jgi:hypothetical protein
MESTGEFETHITVNLNNVCGIKRLHRWCIDRHLKGMGRSEAKTTAQN